MTAPIGRFVEDPQAPRTIHARKLRATYRRRRGVYRSFVKRLSDLFLVLLAAPMVVPMVLLLAFIVSRKGGRPFYSQLRVGKDGKLFRMWKLRTMVVNADEMIIGYLNANPEAKAEWDRTQKLRNDPRISEFGHFLRKSSLDELPQLWNVLKGDMSLVGPRPMLEYQQPLYPGLGYYALRPGLTGYWQVTERNHSSFAERAWYDDRYEEELSLINDVKVMYKTVDVVLKGTGV
ncbi:sugar transferase [Falsigemmobacter intermedius]|uniref:Sugar transferase n=1 Tax=Falsigemmobacter intermedius TaxID=1553448 RepID=A0A3S3WWR2_9RHOB|nr:sugar transferase [Falsigemmobacter intermedius]RWY45511.1 sugar transferase [Falsigemmobacter intermedius]